MYIERVLYPVQVLGYGKRIGIWTEGCKHACPKCINPELWEVKSENDIPVELLIEQLSSIIRANEVDGITISGGDPFYQLDDLTSLIKGLKAASGNESLEILVYTGFVKEEIELMDGGKECLELIDVLIDGPYIDERNVDGLPLRGSDNQRVIFRNKEVERRYELIMQGGRKLQNFHTKESLISVGIHDRR